MLSNSDTTTPETREQRAKASRRKSHAKWAKRHPRKQRASQKAWNRSAAGRACDRRKKAREKTERACLAALDRPGTYVVLRPDGGQTVLRRHADGTWEVLP